MDQIFEKTGFILIDKASGPTSHDVVHQLRKLTGIKKIGHAGTLDPLASGLLICAIGRAATKRIDSIVKQDKAYDAELVLGASSDTYDSQGVIRPSSKTESVSPEDFARVLDGFRGAQEQVPPMFSAKKVGGKKLYELARQGIEIERKACQILINKLELLGYEWPKASLKVECSSGTYIRSLVADIGQALGVGAYMSALRRTRIGVFDIEKAVKMTELTKENWAEYLVEELN